MRRRRSEDVQFLTPPGFLMQLSALRKASLLIHLEQRVIFSYAPKSQESLNIKLHSGCWVGEDNVNGSWTTRPAFQSRNLLVLWSLGYMLCWLPNTNPLFWVKLPLRKVICWVSHVTWDYCALLLEASVGSAEQTIWFVVISACPKCYRQWSRFLLPSSFLWV